MMCHPNSVFTGCEVWPFCKLNAASSNSRTILPLPNVPKSPPFLFEGQRDFSAAILEKLSPLFNLSRTIFASCSVLTRM